MAVRGSGSSGVQVDDLDAAGTLEHAARVVAALRRGEVERLRVAAHWAALHGACEVDAQGRALPGASLLADVSRAGAGRRLGGAGTPEVNEYAAAELGLVLETTTAAAERLIGFALDLAHRFPRTWAALCAGRGETWMARKAVAAAAELGLDQARYVDASVADYLGVLPFGRWIRLVEARVVEADPAAHEARRVSALTRRHVTVGRSTEAGLKTLIAQATAGDVLVLTALLDRIADILATRGDTDPLEARRATALGILARPHEALLLLLDHQAPAAEDPELPLEEQPEPPEPDPTGQPGQPGQPCPSCLGQALRGIDPARLRPRATLHLHCSEESLRAGHRHGLVRVEEIGPETLAALKDLLAHHHLTIRPVLDPTGMVPVDAYEVPAAMRDALRALAPADAFPYGTSLTRTMDTDHTVPFTHHTGTGPPGQTRIGNLGFLTRHHHRLKTHTRWRLKQPHPGVYLWRSPHGWITLVDHTGTHPLGNTPLAHTWFNQAPTTSRTHTNTDTDTGEDNHHTSPLEAGFRHLLAVAS